MNELLQVMRLVFTREMDRYARGFISCYPDAVGFISDVGSIRVLNES